MHLHNTPALNLYHGTSDIFLPGIKESGLGGKNILAELGFYGFIKELAPMLRGHSDEGENYIFNNMANQEVGYLNFQHGHTYLSPSKSTVARYAKNKYGSELLSETVKIIKKLSNQNIGIEELLSGYPEIKTIMARSSNPILITLPNATRFKLLSEHGADASQTIQNVLSTLSQNPGELEFFHQQDNFRLNESVPITELLIQNITFTNTDLIFPDFTVNPLID